MKRKSILILSILLIACFGSCPVFADMTVQYFYTHWCWTIDFNFHNYDSGTFNEDAWSFDGTQATGGLYFSDFDGMGPQNYNVIHELLYNDGIVNGSSTSSGFLESKDNGFTTIIGTNCRVDYPETMEPLDYDISAHAHSHIIWELEKDPAETVLMKVKVNTNDPLCWSSDIPLTFNGEYYYAYLTGDNINGAINASFSSSYSGTGLIDISKDCQINVTFEPVPVPGAALLSLIGLGYSSLRLKRKRV